MPDLWITNSRHHYANSPKAITNEYNDHQIVFPTKIADLKYDHEIEHDDVSRPTETAATDSKLQTDITQNANMKRIGKSLGRRKQKNVNIRKINKRTSKLKKSAKSLFKHNNDCIYEKVEDENVKVWPPVIEKQYIQDVNMMVSPDKTSKKSKLSSLQKPVNELILLQKSIFEGRPSTVFFQYPEYCGYEKDTCNTLQYTQDEFKKQGLSLSFKVTSSTHTYNSVVNSMKQAGFSMISG